MEITFEVTDNCDMNCIHCSTRANCSGKNYMTLEQVSTYLNRHRGFKRVRLSGGEPFNHPNIVDIARLVHEDNRELAILSCGIHRNKSLEEELLRKIKPYVSEIVFSMQGVTVPFELYNLDRLDSEFKCLNCSSIENCSRIVLLSESMENLMKSFGTVAHGGTQYGMFLQANRANPNIHIKRACMKRDCVEHGDIALGARNYDFMKVSMLLEKSLHTCAVLDIPRSIQTVIMNMNFDSLDVMAETVAYHELNWHWLRYIKQGRGEEGNYSPTPQQMARLKDKRDFLAEKYGLNITCTHSFFEPEACDCGLEKKVITCTGEEIECSALKYGAKGGKLACLKRV